MPIELVGRIGSTAQGTAREELFVALHEDKIGPLIDDGLDEDGLAELRALFQFFPELVGVLFPCEALYLRGLKELVELDEFLRELAPGLLRCGELREVSHASGLEDHEYFLKARIHQRDIFR